MKDFVKEKNGKLLKKKTKIIEDMSTSIFMDL